MRKTSFGLGLAGTIIAFVIGVILLIFGAVSTAASYADWDEISENLDDIEITIDGDEYNVDIEGNYGSAPNVVFGAIGAWLIVGAVCLIVAGILGIIGTVITRKRQSVAAGCTYYNRFSSQHCKSLGSFCNCILHSCRRSRLHQR